MSSFDNAAFDVNSFDVDSFDLDGGVAEVFTPPTITQGLEISQKISQSATLSDVSYYAVRVFKE